MKEMILTSKQQDLLGNALVGATMKVYPKLFEQKTRAEDEAEIVEILHQI